jgi:Zn finger protein HypA/HybF involved in hydrogenase expression
VTPRSNHIHDEVESVEEETPAEETETETDGKVELHCPECQQSLRIPLGYTGSVRCPACEEVFSAVDESKA